MFQKQQLEPCPAETVASAFECDRNKGWVRGYQHVHVCSSSRIQNLKSSLQFSSKLYLVVQKPPAPPLSD